MKKRIMQFVFALSCLCLLSSAYAAPGALVIESEYIFDTVPDGTVVFHDFIIKNNKDTLVKILGVKPG